MIQARDVKTSEMARIIYLSASAMSTVLRAHGVNEPGLYTSNPTPLSLWSGLSRGNLLQIARLMTDCICESDRRIGVFNVRRDQVRYKAARRCLVAVIKRAAALPMGPVQGHAPIKIENS